MSVMREYERGVAGVVRHGGGDDATPSLFFAYCITHTPLTTPALPAAPFLLLNPRQLDAEVATLTLRLHLPCGSLAHAQLSPAQQLALRHNEVAILEVFNMWLFNLLLGRASDSFEAYHMVYNKIKSYLVAPLVIDTRGDLKLETKELIDWEAMKTILNSGLVRRGFIQLKPKNVVAVNDDTAQINRSSLNQHLKDYIVERGNLRLDFNKLDLEIHDTQIMKQLSLHDLHAECDNTTPMNMCSLKLHNGYHTVSELMDSIVTCVANNMLYCVVSVSNDLNKIYASVEGSTRKGRWLSRYMTEMKEKSQPFLLGHRLLFTFDFLQSRTGEWCKRKMKQVYLPPELCILHGGFSGRLWRGAERLPSVLYSLEKSLLASELRDQIGKPLSCLQVLEALTSGACNIDVSYERLEFLGDSFLTFIRAVDLYFRDVSKDRDQLALSLFDFVTDKELSLCAEASGLPSYAFAEPFPVCDWIPPGPLVLKSKLFDPCQKDWLDLGFSRMQRMSYKTLADMVEAIIGAYSRNINIEFALKAVSWFNIPFYFPDFIPENILVGLKNHAERRGLLKILRKSDLEQTLNYNFKNDDILCVALSYESNGIDAGLSYGIEAGIHFGRLAFLGNAVFSYLVTEHLIASSSCSKPGTLNELRQSIINGENLACVSVHHKLYKFLHIDSPEVQRCIEDFVLAFHMEYYDRNKWNAYGLSTQCSPRALGNTVLTLVGAIFLDSGLKAEMVWKVIKTLLEPLPTVDSASLHPINELELLCQREHWSLHLQTALLSDMYETVVIVNCTEIANAMHLEKHVSRRFAAMKAIKCLLKDGKRSEFARVS